MYYQIGTRYEACTVAVTVSSLKDFTCKLVAFDASKANTYFTNRSFPLKQGEQKTFWVPMPLTGKTTYIGICDQAAGDRDASLETSFKVVSVKKQGLVIHEGLLPLTDHSLWVFIDLAQRFCYNAGWLKPNEPGLCYMSPNKNFKIQYLDTIRDDNSGAVIPTPARINKETGIIQAAQDKMLIKTVGGRAAIIFHEYAHLNANEDPESELEADLNGVEITLSLGFPRNEILESYDQTFLSVKNPANDIRREHIEQFMKEYDNYFYNH